ncbi:MAG: dihydrodipicolinate reductase, partial [Spirochaetota bacterium]
TGINPGYLMDTLPLVLTAPCLSVRSISVTRMMNAAARRLPFQKKVGVGLSAEAFREAIDSGKITGHVGLRESMQMIAATLGWSPEEFVEESPAPVIAREPTETGLGTVAPGDVVGLTSIVHAREGETERIRLMFHAYAGVEEEYDEVVIDGEPSIRQRIAGGVHGDRGTVAVTVNTAARVVDVAPGLKTMAEIPLVTCAR